MAFRASALEALICIPDASLGFYLAFAFFLGHQSSFVV